MSIIPVILIILILANMSFNNDPGINVFLIVFLCISFISQFLIKCKCKTQNKKQVENLDNTDNTDDIAQTQPTEEELRQQTSTTKTEEKKEELKYLDIDKKFIDGLINENQIIVDNLKIKKIEDKFLFDLLYPVGCIVLSTSGELPSYNGEVHWNILPGPRLIATTGTLKNSVTTSMNINTTPLGKYFSDTYDRYNYNFQNLTNTYKHLDLSSDKEAQAKVKLYGNNIMNHKHVVYLDYQRSGYSKKNTGMKDGKYHSFAIVGGGANNQKNRCVPNNGDKNINTSDPENYEVFPSRSTIIYTNGSDNSKRKKINDSDVKEHSNIPRYVLVFAFQRIK